METVIIAFERESLCQRFSEILESSGVAYCLTCRSGDVVRRLLSTQQIRCVVCGYKLADGAAESLFADLPAGCSMLMVATQAQLDQCGNPDIFRLPSPVGRGDIVSSVRVLLQLAVREERSRRSRRSGEEQELVDQAKRLLMERRGLSEEQAHRLLQKRSMDGGMRMHQTARQLIHELEIGN